MKLSRKVIACLLALTVVLTALPIVLPTGAVEMTTSATVGTGIDSTLYYMPGFIEIIGEDSRSASVSFENNTKFDATIDEMVRTSYLTQTNTGITDVTCSGDGDWFFQKWTGTMTAATAGTYYLIGRKIDNGFVMFVDGVKVYEYWGASHWFDGAEDRLLYNTGFTVEAGKAYDVEIYFLELDGGNALEIYATTTPGDLNSGSNINDAFDFNLTEERYLIGDNTGEFNALVGNGTGDGGTGNGGNGGQCIEDNWKYDESIDKILAKTRNGETKVVNSFSDAIIDKECYVVLYSGYLVPKTSGTYVFGATAIDNGFYLNINGTVAYEFWAGNTWNDNGGNTYPTGIALTAGEMYPFTAAFLETNGGQTLGLVASINGGDNVSANDLFTYYPSTVEEATLDFNLQAVNLLSGATTVNSSSELTVQYTDATLGEGVEMYAQITTTDGTVLVEKQQVGSGFLRVENRNLFVDNENTSVNKDIYSNMAGSVTFNPALSGTYNVSDLKVTIWTEVTGGSSNKATTTINNGFTSGTPSGLNANNWMSYIDGATLLTQINLPGTHDSGAYNPDNSNYSKCQDQTIATQLTYGVRYLDMRFNGENGTATVNGVEGVRNVNIVHGTSACYKTDGSLLTFSDVYASCKAFLEANPSETIVMTLQADNDFDRITLMDCFATFVKADPSLFYTKTNEIPTLDDVRGKIVVLRKFPGVFYGADYAGMDFFWQENSNGTEHPVIPVSSGNAVTTYFVQDDYSLSARSGTSLFGYSYPKWEAAKAFFETAAANKKANQFYLNFLSTAPTLSSPESNAEHTNGQFNNYSLTKGESYGYILFDFVTAALCQKIYATNIFTTTAQASATNNEKANEIVVNYDFATVVDGKLDDTADNGFDGALINPSLLEANSIYDIITFNNASGRGDGAGYINIPQSVFRGTGDTATIQVWIKDAGTAARDTWLSIGRGSTGIAENWFIANTKWDGGGARYSIKTTKVVSGGEEIQNWSATDSTVANQWHLLTYVLNGDNMKIYVDGNSTPVVDNKMNANFSDVYGTMVNSPVRLGAASYWTGDESFIGSMGDFTIYNYAVDTAAIATTYADLAEEYTYILKATLGSDIVAVASETAADTYIDEQYTDEGSAIWFDVPSDYDLQNAKLALEIDGSKVEISVDGGNTYADFDANATYDLSKDVVLKVTSLNGTRTKEYDVNVNGIVVKDYATDAFIAICDELPALEQEGYLAIGYYDSAKAEIVTTAVAGDIVYQRLIAIEKPIITPSASKSIRLSGVNRSGIRFKADINREGEFYQYFNGEGDYVYSADSAFQFGMLIVPQEMLNGAELTKETANVLDIVGEKIYAQDNNGKLEYTGVIYSIPEEKWDMTLVARAYITYTFNGETVTIYSDEVSEGSYLSVAKAYYEIAQQDPETNADFIAELEAIFGDALNS